MRFFHTFLRLFGSLCLPWLNPALGPQLKKLVRSFSPPLYYAYYPTLVSTSFKHSWYLSVCTTLSLFISTSGHAALSVLLESFQEFLCRDEFIPVASLRSQHNTCKDMMKEAWLLCFDEFQVTHISSSAHGEMLRNSRGFRKRACLIK